MNPFEQILRDMAEKAEKKNRFGHLTKEQNVDKMMECNRAFWKHVVFADVETLDVRGVNMLGLLLDLRTMDMADYHADHCLIDEDKAPRKESALRCKFWDKHHEMEMAAVRYAEHCGYITVDRDAMAKETAEIESQYEALKPADGDAARTDAQSDNEVE